MGSVEESQTPQPSWHVQARTVSAQEHSLQKEHILTSSVPSESLLPGVESAESSVLVQPGSQGLSTMPTHPMPKEMQTPFDDTGEGDRHDPIGPPRHASEQKQDSGSERSTVPAGEVHVGQATTRDEARPTPTLENGAPRSIEAIAIPRADMEQIPGASQPAVEALSFNVSSRPPLTARPTWRTTPPTTVEPLPSPRTPSIPSPDRPDDAKTANGEEDELKTDHMDGGTARENETPDIPSPPNSPEPPTTPSARPRRAAAARQKIQTPKSGSPERQHQPITAHNPSPIRSTRSIALPSSASKIPRKIERMFNRTKSAPMPTEPDSFGETPKLDPRQRFEKYMTTSHGLARRGVPEEEDAGEATDQESVKESNTVSQGLILDGPESLPHDKPEHQPTYFGPTQINTIAEPVVVGNGLYGNIASSTPNPNGHFPTSSPALNGVLALGYQPSHLSTWPIADPAFPGEGDEDLDLVGSPTPRRGNGSIGPMPSSEEETEENEQLFTASGGLNREPPPTHGRTGRFARLVSSSNGSEPDYLGNSQLFGTGSEKDFGSQGQSQSEMQMAATQVMQAPLQSSSQPSPLPLQRPAQILIPLAQPDPPGPASASSNSARTTLAPHRRLTRQKVPSTDPAPDPPEPRPLPLSERQQSTGPRAMRTAPLPSMALNGLEPTQISQPFRSAPLPGISGLEPTQVSQPPQSSSVGEDQAVVLPEQPSPDEAGANKAGSSLLRKVQSETNEAVVPLLPEHDSEGFSQQDAKSGPVGSARSAPADPALERIERSSPTAMARAAPVDAQATLQNSSKTLPPTPPPRPAVVKKYGTPKKVIRKSMPSKRVIEAEEVQKDIDMMSDISSGTTVSRDPEDETFHPVKKSKRGSKAASDRGRKGRSRTERDSEPGSEEESEDGQMFEDVIRGTQAQKTAKVTTKRSNNVNHRKRKAPSSSKVSRMQPVDDSDGGSSGTTPFDSEDNTYRPAKRGDTKRARHAVISSRTSGPSRCSSVSTDRARPRLKTNTAKQRGGNKRTNGLEGLAEAEPSTTKAMMNGSGAKPGVEVGKPVMGHWKPTSQYFAGTIQGQEQGEFDVLFYDGARARLPIDRLRRFDIRAGDQVRTNSRNQPRQSAKVLEDYQGDVNGVKVLLSGQETVIPLKHLCISVATINKDWADRLVEPRHLGLSSGVDLVRSGPRSANSLSGKIFLITINVRDPEGAIRKALEFGITTQGGKIAADWPALFEEADNGYWSKLSTKDVPFLLVHGSEGAKPKTLAALAAGIPCISADYIAHTAISKVDWRAYLVSPGRSTVHGQYTSQLIDPNWGESSWNASKAINPRQFLAGKKVLFVIPQKNDSHSLIALLRRLVPFCVHALGAVSLEQIHSAPPNKDLTAYDLVIVEDRGNLKIPASWERTGNVAGGLLAPEMAKESKG